MYYIQNIKIYQKGAEVSDLSVFGLVEQIEGVNSSIDSVLARINLGEITLPNEQNVLITWENSNFSTGSFAQLYSVENTGVELRIING